MSLTKKALKSKPVCKVTFKVPATTAPGASSVFIVGDFNDWSESSHPLKGLKDGSFSTTIDLETGKSYQFRYLIDGSTWENDDAADKYVTSPFGTENSVVEL
ncbi:MAG: isoamylase early set domain-containing protein [Bacteroidia bacterium]|nr:isoamylase early set domain-containing protein [Bacteroidia bacterium]